MDLEGFGLPEPSLCAPGDCVPKSVQGQVIRADGQPVKKAIVQAIAGWVLLDADTTAANGRYSLSWHETSQCRDIVVHARLPKKKGYRSDTIQVCDAATHDFKF